ncbi:MAG: hypothetical protein U5N85_01450 [Arcicella sp.]|nr:hypothetical protein [Arcicella sp.]
MKDSADYQNSFCFYQKLEFLNSSEALVKNKVGESLIFRVVRGDSGLVGIIHPKNPPESLILTLKDEGKLLQGRGYKFIKIK